MIEKNTICHYLNLDGICLTLADITDAALEAAKRHNMSDQAAAMLGEIMAGTAILATDFKNHEGVSLRWDTHGPRGNIHTDAYEGKYLRGYMDHPEAAGADESILNEHGMLYVTRYSLLRMPYTSSVELKGHDVSSCLTDYMKESDQTLSHIQTAVIRDEQGRILFHKLPFRRGKPCRGIGGRSAEERQIQPFGKDGCILPLHLFSRTYQISAAVIKRTRQGRNSER